MQTIALESVPADSACAVVARSSAVEPQFLVADGGAGGVMAALWRRRRASLLEPKRLSDHLLSYCTAGGGDCIIEVDGTRRRVHHTAGTVTFLPAGHAVSWRIDAPREMAHVHLYLPPQLFPAGFADTAPDGVADPAPAATLIGAADPWLGHYVNLLLAEVESCSRLGTLESSAFLQETGPLVVQHLIAASRRAPPRRPSRVSPLRPALLSRIEQFVDERLSADIPLEQLAAIASLSVDHFVRAFDQAIGMTPHHYLVERRLERSRALLRDSSLAVGEIAQACGFSSPTHFSVMFHRRYGISPSRYRRL